MFGSGITVSVYALDHVQLPKAETGRGWASRLKDLPPDLTDLTEPRPLTLGATVDGWAVAEPIELTGAEHLPGARAQIEAVAGRPDLFLVRLSGRPVAIATCPGRDARHDTDLERVPAAYAGGTLIDTPDGARPVETLVAGDVVTTVFNGSRPLRWVGRRRIEPIEMLAHAGLCPIAFAEGSIGNARPLMLSPRQRILVDDWRAEVYFGEDRVFVAAAALADDVTARLVLPAEGVEYVTLLCDRHEVLLAEGALSDSFHPGDADLDMLTRHQQSDLAGVIEESDLRRRRAAFPIVQNAEARALRLRS